ncbi:hypothetical protein LLEC1_01330 [Akanthomyces lecanii]|uniref:Tat pathway signal sequence n=1 Tax=Cordyceps confragosa TaxID=2714763 RepID=A0A179IDI8_CORDF|nr:hypothetical protein LLEC1_01330 [Akanthomyces lecanii]
MDHEKRFPSTSLDDDFESETLLPNALLSYRLGADFEKKRMRYLLISLFGITVYTLAVMGITVSTLRKVDYECRGGPHLYPNILEDAIEYRLETFADNHKPDHPFFGEPSKELDHNWHELTKWSDVRIPESEVERLGREYQGVHFTDGGYYGMLTVHHNLHCLKRLYQHMNVDHYFPNMTDEERQMESQHTIHCMALIKNALMCQADTTLLTMRWLDFSPIPAANWSTPRTCVDWSRIDDWTKDNWVDAKKDGRMVHPKFGQVFVNGKHNGSRIGVSLMHEDHGH